MRKLVSSSLSRCTCMLSIHLNGKHIQIIGLAMFPIMSYLVSLVKPVQNTDLRSRAMRNYSCYNSLQII